VRLSRLILTVRHGQLSVAPSGLGAWFTSATDALALALMGRRRAMTDMGRGVYVMRTDSEAWVSDEEVGGLVQTLFEDGESAGGLWKPGDRGAVEGDVLPARETIVVLQGTVRIEIDDGPTLNLTAGDMASMPKGATTSWHPSRDFKEVWLYS
jgi:uncharacterized cupin superfamily protein